MSYNNILMKGSILTRRISPSKANYYHPKVFFKNFYSIVLFDKNRHCFYDNKLIKKYATSTTPKSEIETDEDNYEMDYITMKKVKKSKPNKNNKRFVDPNIFKAGKTNVLLKSKSIQPFAVITDFEKDNLELFIAENIQLLSLLFACDDWKDLTSSEAIRKLSSFKSNHQDSISVDDSKIDEFIGKVANYVHTFKDFPSILYQQYYEFKHKLDLYEKGAWKYRNQIKDILGITDLTYLKPHDIISKIDAKCIELESIENITSKLEMIKLKGLKSLISELEPNWNPLSLMKIIEDSNFEAINEKYVKKMKLDPKFQRIIGGKIEFIREIGKEIYPKKFGNFELEDLINQLKDKNEYSKFANFISELAIEGYYIDEDLSILDDIAINENKYSTSNQYRQIPDNLDIYSFQEVLKQLKAYMVTSGYQGSFSQWTPHDIQKNLNSLINSLAGYPISPFLGFQSRLVYLLMYNGGNTSVLDSLIKSEEVFKQFEAKISNSDSGCKNENELIFLVKKNEKEIKTLCKYFKDKQLDLNTISSQQFYDELQEFKNLYSFGKIGGIGTDHYDIYDDLITQLNEMIINDDKLPANLEKHSNRIQLIQSCYDNGLWMFVDELPHLQSFINFLSANINEIIEAIETERRNILNEINNTNERNNVKFFSDLLRSERYTFITNILEKSKINPLALEFFANDERLHAKVKKYAIDSGIEGELLQDARKLHSDLKFLSSSGVISNFENLTISQVLKLLSNKKDNVSANTIYKFIFEKATEGKLNENLLKVLDIARADDATPYIQVPDHITLHEFSNELSVLKEKVGKSFRDVSPLIIYQYLDEMALEQTNEGKKFKIKKLNKKLHDLFALNGSHTEVLDLACLNHNAFENFEKKLTTNKYQTNLKSLSKRQEELLQKGTWEFLEQVQEINKSMNNNASLEKILSEFNEELIGFKIPKIDDVTFEANDEAYFQDVCRLQKLQQFLLFYSQNRISPSDINLLAKIKDVANVQEHYYVSSGTENLFIKEIRKNGWDLAKSRKIIRSGKFSDFTIPSILAFCYSKKDMDDAKYLYQIMIDFINKGLLCTSSLKLMDSTIEDLSKMNTQIPDDLEIYDSIGALRQLNGVIPNFTTARVYEIMNALDKLFEESTTDDKNQLFKLKVKLNRLFELNGGNTSVLNTILVNDTIFYRTDAKINSDKSYYQIPEGFNLEEFVPEIQMTIKKLGGPFKNFQANTILEAVLSLSENSANESTRRNLYKLYKNLIVLFKYNNYHTFILDNILKSNEVFEQFEAKCLNSKPSMESTIIEDGDVKRVFELYYTHRPLIAKINEIGNWKTNSKKNSEMDKDNFDKVLDECLKIIENENLYEYSEIVKVSNELKSLNRKIDNFMCKLNNLLKISSPNFIDVRKVLTSSMQIEQPKCYSHSTKKISHLSNKTERANVGFNSILLRNDVSPITKKAQSKRLKKIDKSTEILKEFLKDAKIQDEKAKQSKFRQQNAYEWSSSKLKSNRCLESRNFFNPSPNATTLHDGSSLQKEYLLWTWEGHVIKSKLNPLGKSHKSEDMVTVLGKFDKKQLYHLMKIVKKYQKKNWVLIGGNSEDANAMLVFARSNQNRNKTYIGYLRSFLATTGGIFLLLMGINWYFEDVDEVSSNTQASLKYSDQTNMSSLKENPSTVRSDERQVIGNKMGVNEAIQKPGKGWFWVK